MRELIPSNKQSTRPRTTPATTATACVQSADGRKRYLPVAQTQVGRTFYDLRLRLVLLVLRLRLRARRPSPPPSSRARTLSTHSTDTRGHTRPAHAHTLPSTVYEVNIYIKARPLSCLVRRVSAAREGSSAVDPSRGGGRWSGASSSAAVGTHGRSARWTRSTRRGAQWRGARVCIPKLEGVQLSKMCRGSKRSCIY